MLTKYYLLVAMATDLFLSVLFLFAFMFKYEEKNTKKWMGWSFRHNNYAALPIWLQVGSGFFSEVGLRFWKPVCSIPLQKGQDLNEVNYKNLMNKIKEKQDK